MFCFASSFHQNVYIVQITATLKPIWKGKDINIVVIASIDVGKSTTTSRLIYKCGGLDRNSWKVEKVAAEREKTFSRMQGLEQIKSWVCLVSIDFSLWKPESSKHYVTIIDVPRDSDFIQTQNKTWLSIVVLVLVNFEAGFTKDGPTCEHAALLAYTLCQTTKCRCQQSGSYGATLKPEVSMYMKKAICKNGAVDRRKCRQL